MSLRTVRCHLSFARYNSHNSTDLLYSVVMITYGVGAMKILNAIGGAHAEFSPVLVISGAPGINTDKGGHDEKYVHHSIYKREDSVQRRLFREVCVEEASLDSPRTAPQEIIKVLNGIRAYSRPGYLQIPRDRFNRPLAFPMPQNLGLPIELQNSAPNRLVPSECNVTQGMKVLRWMRSRQRPVVLAGAIIQRFKLENMLLNILEREGWMCATSLSGKTLIPETHPLSLGIYNGAMANESVRDDVESSDGVLLIGFPLDDIDTGMFTFGIKPDVLVTCDIKTGLQWTHSDNPAADQLLMPGLLLKVWSDAELAVNKPKKRPSYSPKAPNGPFVPAKKQTTLTRLIEAVGCIVDDKSIVLAEIGDSLFASMDLHLPMANTFLTSGFWGTLGFVLPGAVGAWFANKESRPIVLVGDGSLLMSAIELATLARYNVPALVIVLDNQGYGTERPMLDGPFNDIQQVDHAMLATAYGFKKANRVDTEEELWRGLQEFYQVEDGPTLISVSLGKFDFSKALIAITGGIKKIM